MFGVFVSERPNNSTGLIHSLGRETSLGTHRLLELLNVLIPRAEVPELAFGRITVYLKFVDQRIFA